MATQLQDGNTPCLAATLSDPRPTVLVFDSGVGGLSVYDEIRRLLPDLHYIERFRQRRLSLWREERGVYRRTCC